MGNLDKITDIKKPSICKRRSDKNAQITPKSLTPRGRASDGGPCHSISPRCVRSGFYQKRQASFARLILRQGRYKQLNNVLIFLEKMLLSYTHVLRKHLYDYFFPIKDAFYLNTVKILFRKVKKIKKWSIKLN